MRDGENEGKLLLDAARAGDPAAFDRLLRPMLGSLLAMARRLAPPGRGEDLLQEALIRAHRGLPRFRGDCALKPWILRILHRCARDPRRFLGSPGPVHPGAGIEAIPDGLDRDPAVRVSARDVLHRVEEAIERLPLRLRTAIHLRAVEGWSYERIAEVLESSPGAARNAVLRARRLLRDRFEDLL